MLFCAVPVLLPHPPSPLFAPSCFSHIISYHFHQESGTDNGSVVPASQPRTHASAGVGDYLAEIAQDMESQNPTPLSSSFFDGLQNWCNDSFGIRQAELQKLGMGVDEKEVKLAEAAKSGFDLRGSLGQAFSRDKAGKADYKKLGSNAERAKFRQEWAAKRYEKVKLEKSRSRSYARVDLTEGEYLPLAMVIQAEGGREDRSAIAAALKLAQKCLAMGPPWTRFNAFTERTEFLRLRHRFQESITNSWQLFEKEYAEKVRNEHIESAGEDTGTEGEGMSSAGEQLATPPKTAATSSAASPNKPIAKAKGKSKTPPSQLDIAIREASKWKNKYYQVHGVISDTFQASPWQM